MFQQKTWFWKRRSRLYIGSSELNTSFSKFKGSIFAVLLGLIIGSFVIMATGNNVFTYFEYITAYAFTSFGFNSWDVTLTWWSIFIIAGLALVVSFKTGMFNIGVAGQMLAAGAAVLALGIQHNFSQPVFIVLAFICGTLASIFVALVIALLKALFNVHEVVSSILLNWIIWYIIKWAFITTPGLYNGTTGSSSEVHNNLSLAIDGYKFIIPLVLALFLVVAVWFLLKKTTLGYKVKTVGLNPFASDYAGINRKRYSVTAFAISGALAGIMAVVYYVSLNPSLNFANDTLPTIGFDAISIALVGQINPYGVVGAAFLWGFIRSGATIGSTALGIPDTMGDIIFGVIIYSAACAVLLTKLEPIKYCARYFNVVHHNSTRPTFFGYYGEIWKQFIKSFNVRKEYNKKIKALKKSNPENAIGLSELMTKKQEEVKVCFVKMRQAYKEKKQFVHKEYLISHTTGIRGIHNKAVQEKKALYGEQLNNYINAKIDYEDFLHQEKLAMKQASKSFKANNDYQNMNQIGNDSKQAIIDARTKLDNCFAEILKKEKQVLKKIIENVNKEKQKYHHQKSKSKGGKK